MSQEKSQFPRIEKNAMRQITNSSKNKLASRLYRNSSLNHIHPNTSMLSSFTYDVQPSLLNSSASNSQLVASISLKKFKRKADNQPYLSINNGKLLINKGDSYFTSDRSPKQSGRRLFKKLDKITQPMNKILPDQLIDFPIEKQLFQESRCIKKANLSPSKTQKNRFSQDKQDLLPEDFIQLIEEDRNITNQFCYLKKMDHPYDLKIIEFDKNMQKKADNSSMEYPSQYITISSRGVTYFSQDQSRFVSLQQWKKQANYFKKIIKLNFFKNFKLIKNFSNWKKYLRKSAMKSTVQKLKQVLVYNDLYLSKSLLRIKQICYSMETDVSYCKFDDCQKVHDIKQFRASHEVFLANQFERKISELEENIKEVLITNMSVSMKQFKQENKISSSMEGKGMPLLIGDQKNLEMPYTKEATLRTQQQKFQKFVKLVDIIITHSKVNMMSESTEMVAKKLEEDNYNYERQVISSNYKNNYKGKQYLQCILTLDPKQQSLYLKPTRDDLSMLFQDIVSRSVVRVCRYHKKISSDIDILSIIYDSQDQFPKESESQNLKAIMTSDNRQQKMQKDIMKPITVSYNYVLNYIEKFRKISKFYFENMQKLEQIQNFQPRDYEAMGNYLENWQKQKQEISEVANQHQGALFQLNLKQFKEQTERLTDTCIRKIKALIPKIYEASANQLQKQLTQAREKVNRRPVGIEAIMLFSEDVERNMNNEKDYEEQKFQLQFLENLIVVPSNSEQGIKKVKKTIHPQLQGLRDDLKTAWDYIQAYKNKAQQQVKLMKSNSKLIVFYSQIKQLIQQDKTSEEMLSFVKKKRTQFTEIRKQFSNINTYEKFLGLEESDSTEIQNFEGYFNAFQKIWITVNQFQQYSQNIVSKTCKQIKTSQVFAKLQQFGNTISDLKKIVSLNKDKQTRFQYTQNDHNALENAFQHLQKTLRPLTETIECLNETTFGEKQWKQIRLTLATRSPQILKVLQVDKNQRKVADLLKVQVEKQLPFLQKVANKSKRNNQIVKKLQAIKNYTNYTKQHPGLFRNLTEKFKSEVGNFLQDIDQKIMMANYVLQYSENNESERAKAEKNTLERLREILILWDQYQQHVQYFQPIYINSDWKNTPQAKNYMLATEQNWKKTYKGFRDSTFSKILTAQRVIPSLKQSNQVLQSLYPAVKNYFNLKRQQCPRLNFVSDSQILKIYMQNKDFKGLNNYVNKLFSGVSQLRIKQDEQLPYEAVNMDGQAIPLKIMRTPNFQVEQMLKSTDEFLKISIKASLKNCHFVYDTEQFNKQAWIQDNILQILVFVTNVYFTRIIENDYMGNDREDKKKLLYYHLSQVQQLEQFLNSRRNTQVYSKISVLLTQAILIRDTIYFLISEQIESKQAYGWLKQIRSYYNPGPPQQAYNEYLNVPIAYGNQFVCMKSNPILTTSSNQKMTIQLVNSIFNCNIIPISGKGLLSQLATFNAKPHNCVFLSAGSETNSLRNVIEGTWLTGSFTDIYLSDLLNEDQLKVIANTIHQVHLAVTLKQPYLRGFKNLSLNRQACISLVSSNLASLPLLKKNYFEYRVFTPLQVSWEAYINLILEINGHKIPNMANKLAKTLNYLQNTFSNFNMNRSQVKSLIQEIDFKSQDEIELPRRILKRIYKKQYKLAEKKLISKLFFDVFGIPQGQKVVSMKSIRDTNVCYFEINRLIAILKENKVCIITGTNTQFKHFIAYQVHKHFSEKGNYPRPTVFRNQDLNGLLGYYRNNKWIDGAIPKKLKQSSNKKQCLILVGSFSQILMKMLEQLNQKNNCFNYINLPNGQKLRLGSNQRIIALIDHQFRDPVFDGYNVKIVDFQAIKFQAESIFQYLAQKKVFSMKKISLESRYFSSHFQSLASLQNLYLNNLQKIGNSNLKMLGHRSDYNEPHLIMSRFVTILNACLVYDKDKICLSNSKMMEKLYVWSLHWSIGSCLPRITIQKLDKLFDSIKIEYDKSQSLCESKLLISERNKTVSKFIKQRRVFEKRNKQNFLITQQMEAKKQLIKMLVEQNTPIMLIGQRFSGKSSYIQYLYSFLKGEGHSVLKTKITKETSLDKFFTLIKKCSIIQYFPSSQTEKYQLCSRIGKKLVIFVDNFNLIDVNSDIFHFFETASLYQYYYDPIVGQKVYLNNVCFICAKNDAFEDINKQICFPLQFFPIYVNLPELGEIMNTYTQDLKKDQLEINSKLDLASKILPTIATLHNFVNNLISSQKSGEKIPLSYEIALWIGKQIMRCVDDKNCNVQEILSLWKYLTVKKYIESGFVRRFEQQITRELNNLCSLIVKSVNQPENFLRKQIQITKKLDLQKPTLDYYIFFAYLLKSKQYRNLITRNCQTPISIKISALKIICQQYGLDFIHYKNQEISSLKNNKLQVIYVQGSNKNLGKIIQLMIDQFENNKFIFIIDFVTEQQFSEYIRFFPCIKSMAHIYERQEYQEKQNCQIKYYDTVCSILRSLNIKQEGQLISLVLEKLAEKPNAFQNMLNNRLSQLQRGVKNIAYLSQYLEDRNAQCAKIQAQISKLTSQQQKSQQKKSILIDQIEQLKSKIKSGEDPKFIQKKQQINKAIRLMDTQLRKLKNLKKDLRQSEIKIKQNCKDKQEVYALLEKFREICPKSFSICSKIKQKNEILQTASVLHAFLNLYYQQKNNIAKCIIEKFADKYCEEKISTSFSFIYQVLLRIKITNVFTDQCIIKWHLSNFRLVFVTNWSDQLIEKLQSSNPETRECCNQYDYNQHTKTRPILVKDPQYFGQAQATLIIKDKNKAKEIKDITYLTYVPSQKQMKAQFQSKVYVLISELMGQDSTSERSVLRNQLKKIQFQYTILLGKLNSKMFVETSQFSSVNSLAEIKMLSEGVAGLMQRMNSNLLKLGQFQQKSKKYGKIVEKVDQMQSYLKVIAQMYPYANIPEKHLIQIITRSITILETQSKIGQSQPVVEQGKQDKQKVQIKKQLLVDQSVYKIEQKICQWVFYNLTPLDSIHAYFIFACIQAKNSNELKKQQLDAIINLLKGSNQCEFEKILLPQLSKTLKSIIQKSSNSLQLMLDFAQKRLKFNIRKLLNSREQWLTSLNSLFYKRVQQTEQSQIQTQKLFVLVRSSASNGYKIIDKEIRKNLSNDQTVIYLLESDSVEHKIQALEKSSGNSQGWIVLQCNSNVNKINKLIQYVLKARNYRLVLFFDNQQQLDSIKSQIITNNYYQICLHEKAKSISYQIIRILNKYNIQNASKQTKAKKSSLQIQNSPDLNRTVKKSEQESSLADTNKMLRIVSAQLIHRLLINIINENWQSNAYYYRIFQIFAKKVSEVSLQDTIQFSIDFFFDSSKFQNRHLLKEAKRMYSQLKSFDQFDDNTANQIFSVFLEGFNQLKQRFDKEIKIKQFCDKYLEENVANQIQIDELLGFVHRTKSYKLIQKKKLDRTKALGKLNTMLQKLPILSKLQDPDKNMILCFQILKSEKKSIELNYSKKIQQIKRLIKILQSKRYLTLKTQQQILNECQQVQNITQKLLKLHSKLNSIQRLIESKEALSLTTSLQLTSKPKQFLHAYLLQNQNLSKVDWTNFKVKLKCINQKERQILKDLIEKGQYVLLSNLKIWNARYQNHKNFIECIGKSESSKLTNVLLFIGKTEVLPFVRRVPLIVKNIKVAEVAIVFKAKQTGNTCPEPYVTFTDKEAQKQQQKKR